jgi:hypothetical protein
LPSNVEAGYNTMTTVNGPMRLRMAYDATAKAITYAIDYNPAGPLVSDFVADQTFAAVDVSSIAAEWAGGEKSSLYFGGQGYVTNSTRVGTIFTDLLVVADVQAIHHFDVTAGSPQPAGGVFDVTIAAKDASNNTINDSVTTVTASSPSTFMEFDWNSDGAYGDASGTLVGGVITIKARNKKAETTTIAASGGGASTTTPPSLTTVAGPFAKLQILAPNETAAPGTATGKAGIKLVEVPGQPFIVIVNAVDDNWNPVSSTHTIAITSTDGTATLPADAALVAGARTNTVALNQVGSYTITATDLDNGAITADGVLVYTVAKLTTPIPGTWKSLPIQYAQTPDINGWNAVPVASPTIPQAAATGIWKVKQIKVCNDNANVYFLVELWPGSTKTLGGGDIENYFWIDGDNNPATGFVNPDGTGVGAANALRVWQVWAGDVRQVFSWGVSASLSPNANAMGPGGNPFGGWQADTGLYYEYSMALAATNTDGSRVFPSNTVTFGFGSRAAGKLQALVPAFSYTLALMPTDVSASSGTQPSGYQDAVAFTASVSPSNATGSVVFSSTAGAFSTNVLVGGSATSLSITNLPRGTNVISVAYLGDAYYQGSTTNVNQIVTNHSPIAPNWTAGVAAGDTVTLAIIGGKHPPTDPDGDALTVMEVGIASSGTASLLSPTSLSYTANGATGTNTFTYTVSDAFGGSGQGIVTVVVSPAAPGPNMVTGSLIVNNGVATMRAFGMPGVYYQLQYTLTLTPVSWLDVTNAPVLAAPNGSLVLIDSDAGGSGRYYRIRVSGP